MLSEKWGACCAGEARESVFSPDKERAYEWMVIKATSLRSRVLMISEMEDQQYKLNHYLPFSPGACQKCSNY